MNNTNFSDMCVHWRPPNHQIAGLVYTLLLVKICSNPTRTATTEGSNFLGREISFNPYTIRSPESPSTDRDNSAHKVVFDMLAALKSRSLLLQTALQPWKLGFTGLHRSMSSSNAGFLDLNEVERILHDVKADDVKVIPVKEQCGWTDYMVIATGRSTWHVRNIAEALIYKVKQKQEGVERKLLPTVEGHQGGKWIVIDSGKVIIHALDENARAYYNLENLWIDNSSKQGQIEDLDKVLVKVRRKNNSKKPSTQKSA